MVDDWLFDENDKKLTRIVVTFNTNMRELLSLVFETDDTDIPTYSRDISYIENKDQDDKRPKDYNLNDFKESDHSTRYMNN